MLSGSVWENMARMCVKTKRLDVAMVCLGKYIVITIPCKLQIAKEYNAMVFFFFKWMNEKNITKLGKKHKQG